MTFQNFMGPSWPWSNGSFDRIYNYLCNQCLSQSRSGRGVQHYV